MEIKQNMYWIAGYMCSGKTFIGDYLASRGWHHIDGDVGNFSKDPEVKAAWGKIFGAMQKLMKDENPGQDEWKPYFDILISLYKEGIQTGKNVVLTFSILNAMDEKAYVVEQLPEIQFVVVNVDKKELIKRNKVRRDITFAKAGLTAEEVWKSDKMKEMRAKYGEEYSDEIFDKMLEGEFLRIKITANNEGDPRVKQICNDDLSSNQGITEFLEIVGMDFTEPDTEAIQNVNYERFTDLNLAKD